MRDWVQYVTLGWPSISLLICRRALSHGLLSLSHKGRYIVVSLIVKQSRASWNSWHNCCRHDHKRRSILELSCLHDLLDIFNISFSVFHVCLKQFELRLKGISLFLLFLPEALKFKGNVIANVVNLLKGTFEILVLQLVIVRFHFMNFWIELFKWVHSLGQDLMRCHHEIVYKLLIRIHLNNMRLSKGYSQTLKTHWLSD